MKILTEFSPSFIPSKNNIVHGALLLTQTIINQWIQDDEIELLLNTAVEKEKVLSYIHNINPKKTVQITSSNLAKAITRFNPDIIYTATCSATYLKLRNYLKRPIPCINTIHTLGTTKTYTQLLSFIEHSTKHDILICPTEAVKTTAKKIIKQHYKTPPVTLVTIPHGIDIKKYTPTKNKALLKKSLKLPQNSLIFSSITRLNPLTKMDIYPLIKCFQTICKEHPNIILLFVGQAHHQRYIKEIKQWIKTQKLQKNIRFITKPNQEKIEHYYQLSDVSLSLADNPAETFCLTPIEAMACEIPIILSKLSCQKHHIINGKEGFYIDIYSTSHINLMQEGLSGSTQDYGIKTIESFVFDKQQLINDVKKLVKNPQLRQHMGKNGRTRVKKYFSLEKMLENYTTLFKKMIKKKPNAMRFPKSKLILSTQLLSHQASKLVTQRTIFQLSDYGQNVVTGKDVFVIFEAYTETYTQMKKYLAPLLSGPKSVKTLLDPSDPSEGYAHLLFLFKHDLIAIKK